MDNTQDRLLKCFMAVFPSLSRADISKADAANTEGWDSVASVTLFATIEEEFNTQIDLQDAASLLSFSALLDYLRTKRHA
jgi:acyl carrier protein